MHEAGGVARRRTPVSLSAALPGTAGARRDPAVLPSPLPPSRSDVFDMVFLSVALSDSVW